MASFNILIVVGNIEDENYVANVSNFINTGIQTWVNQLECSVDVNSLLLGLNINNACHLEEEYLARCTTLEHSIENYSITLLSNPTCLILNQKIAMLLTSSSDHSLLVFGGHFMEQSSGWCLQDGIFSVQSFNHLLAEERIKLLVEKSKKSTNLTIMCKNREFWEMNLNISINIEIVDSVLEKQQENLYTSSNEGLQNLTLILDDLLSEQTKGIFSQLEPPLQEGQLRSNNPCLYVMPGGTGDSALFVCSDFNILLNGGSLTRPWFWKLLRHQYTLDCIIATHLSAGCLTGINSLLLRKVQENQLCLLMDNTTGEHKTISRCKISPDIKMLFMNIPCNFLNKVLKPGYPMDTYNNDIKLAVQSTHIVKETLRLAQSLNLEIEPLSQGIDPITVFYKISVGKLDLYILSPLESSIELKYIQEKWGLEENKLQETGVTMDNGKKGKSLISDLASICCLLVFQPRAKDGKIIRILFPGNAPQTKILEGLEKLNHLDFLKIPNPTKSLVDEFKDGYHQNNLKQCSPMKPSSFKMNSASKPTNNQSQSKGSYGLKKIVTSKPNSTGSGSITTFSKNKTDLGPCKTMASIKPKGKPLKQTISISKESPSKTKFKPTKSRSEPAKINTEPPKHKNESSRSKIQPTNHKAGPQKTKAEPKNKIPMDKKAGSSIIRVPSKIAPAKRVAPGVKPDVKKPKLKMPATSTSSSKVSPIRTTTEKRHKVAQNLEKKNQKSDPAVAKKMPNKFTSKTFAPSTSKLAGNAQNKKKEDNEPMAGPSDFFDKRAIATELYSSHEIITSFQSETPKESVTNNEPQFSNEQVDNLQSDMSENPIINIPSAELVNIVETEFSDDLVIISAHDPPMQLIRDLEQECSYVPDPSDEPLANHQPEFSGERVINAKENQSDEQVTNLETQCFDEPFINLDPDRSVDSNFKSEFSDGLIVNTKPEPFFDSVGIANLETQCSADSVVVANFEPELSHEPVFNTKPDPFLDSVVVANFEPELSDEPVVNIKSDPFVDSVGVANIEPELSDELVVNTKPDPLVDSVRVANFEPEFSDEPDINTKPDPPVDSVRVANFEPELSDEPVVNTKPDESVDSVVVVNFEQELSHEPVVNTKPDPFVDSVVVANFETELSDELVVNTKPDPFVDSVVVANFETELSDELVVNTKPDPFVDSVGVANFEPELSDELVVNTKPDPFVDSVGVANFEPELSDEPVVNTKTDPFLDSVGVANIEPELSDELVVNTKPDPPVDSVGVANFEPELSDEPVVNTKTDPFLDSVGVADIEPELSDELVVNTKPDPFVDSVGVANFEPELSDEPVVNTKTDPFLDSVGVADIEPELSDELVVNTKPDPPVDSVGVANFEPEFFHEPVVNTEPDPLVDSVVVANFEPEFSDEPVINTEPYLSDSVRVANFEPEFSDEPAVNAEPDPLVDSVGVANIEPELSDELVVNTKPDPLVDSVRVANFEPEFFHEPVVNTEPDPLVDSVVVANFEPELSDEPVVNTKPDPFVDSVGVANFEPESFHEPVVNTEPDPLVDSVVVANFEPELSDEPVINIKSDPFVDSVGVADFEPEFSDEPDINTKPDMSVDSVGVANFEPEFSDEPLVNIKSDPSDNSVELANLESDNNNDSESFNESVADLVPEFFDKPDIIIEVNKSDEPENLTPPIANIQSEKFDDSGCIELQHANIHPENVVTQAANIEPYIVDRQVTSVTNIVNNNVGLHSDGATISNTLESIFEPMSVNKSTSNNTLCNEHNMLQLKESTCADGEIRKLSNIEHQNSGDFLDVTSMDANRNFAESDSKVAVHASNSNSDDLCESISSVLLKGNESNLTHIKGNAPAYVFDAMGKDGIKLKPSSGSGKKSAHSSSFYFDLAYIPHHGNKNSVGIEFFKKIRSKYYVVSGLNESNEEPNEKVLDYLLKGKKMWESSKTFAKSTSVTVIPTHNSPALHSWYQKNHRELESENIHLVAAGSKVMMQNEMVEACKIEF